MKKNMTRLLMALILSCLGATSSFAHLVPWRAGESRQLGFGHCAKGPCMKRTYWGETRPHRHVNGKVVFDKYLRSTRFHW